MPTKSLSFVEAIKSCFSKYVTFKGRARRSEFWWFYLLNALPSVVLCYMLVWKMNKRAELESQIYDAVFSGGDTAAIMAQAQSADSTFFTVAGIACVVSLLLFLPMLAVWVRRLHDTGKTGHLLWLCLFFGIGGIIPLLFCLGDSKREANKYGPSPKYQPQV